ncbi:unnamed protein product [Adineta steineri]|uniref:Uncharacterized protein n=1 Tax=Adineta steineri TaxID=433720 RepID=A0A815MUZ6_9BILA|nr:unnamed protein product [Adineta steineri]CAF3908558.1 unnamed protein product [Adineta steineri]
MNNTINIIDENNSNNIIIHTNPSSAENEGEDKKKTNPIVLLINQMLMGTKMNNDKKNEEDTEVIAIDYWNMSDAEFKQRLLTSVKNDIHRKAKIQQWLEVDPNLSQLGRQYSYLIANVYSLKMEQDFWKTYQGHTRIEALWLSKMSKPILKRNNISEAFFKTENFMNHHLKTIEKRSRKAIAKLDEHLQKQEEGQLFKLSTINKSLFSAAIIALVRQDQSPLHKKYEEQTSELMLNSVNEQVLSQQLDQLSPFKQQPNQNEKQKSSKDMIQEQTTNVVMDFDLIPDYLLKTNHSFEKRISCILPSNDHLEELRNITILIHKLMSIEIVHSLWIVYQKAGMGNLPSITIPTIHEINRKIWLKEVRSLLKQQSQTEDINEIDYDDDACLIFVSNCLHDFNNKSQQYRRELNLKTSCLSDYTRSLECIIEKFVKENLKYFRMETDQQIALVQYDYTDQILKRAYFTQNPNENQITTMKNLCKLKLNQEMTKHEVNLLKENILTYIPSHPFERESSIAQTSFIDRIHNPKIRQQLYKQYKNVAEQARNSMMTVYMNCAEGQKQQCQIQYDIGLKNIYDTENNHPSHQRLTKSMWDLIEHLSANITARIECLYKFKKQLFQLKSNIH